MMTDDGSENALHLNALLPQEMARRAEEIGARKVAMDALGTLALAVLAGAFIALGGVFATTTLAGTGAAPWGAMRVLAGVTFSLGLILVIVGGAELFTGNALIVMAWASRRVTTRALLRNWLIVFVGNFLGAAATAGLVFLGGVHHFGGGGVGVTALGIAHAKLQLGFGQAVALGILCNALVCLAVWLSYSARTTADRILAIVPPISAFVAAGFEHSIANMYFFSVALLLKWHGLALPPGGDAITVAGMFGNLGPVIAGNLTGGSVLVALVYWVIYLRRPPHVKAAGAEPGTTGSGRTP